MTTLFDSLHLGIIAVIFLAALFILSKSADYLTDTAIGVSQILRIPEMVVGATIVSIGTTLPELATSISAVLTGSNALECTRLRHHEYHADFGRRCALRHDCG
ncbi:hypothetical protein [Pseudolactococcus insecticola]|uniref:hypothetical protein n=1 Tax=Pseudolactococcus insecticola TaxID=2709158 RepID=UPI001551807E|nr:hypothetical protein [Lactococcus insecticola]